MTSCQLSAVSFQMYWVHNRESRTGKRDDAVTRS